MYVGICHPMTPNVMLGSTVHTTQATSPVSFQFEELRGMKWADLKRELYNIDETGGQGQNLEAFWIFNGYSHVFPHHFRCFQPLALANIWVCCEMVTPGVKLKKSTFEKVCWGGSFCHSNWPRPLVSLEHEMISIFQLTTDHLNFYQHIGDILWFPWDAHINEHLGSWLQVPKIDTDLTEEKTTTDTGAAMETERHAGWSPEHMVEMKTVWFVWHLLTCIVFYWHWKKRLLIERCMTSSWS